LLLVVLAAALLAAAGTARAEVVWLCEPGAAENPCDESVATTVQAADGSEQVVTPRKPARPPVDCFYVYPTVSEQPGVNADKSKDPQQIAIARYQAARFSLRCRVFAPMYRQLTLNAIYTGSPQARAEGRKIAYADVREAFRRYLRRDNHGRGFVLIGHSQGTFMLRQLIREEIDTRPAVRRRLVSGLLLGGNVLVRKGETLGGDFAHVPICTDARQYGCVVAFSIFGDPPPSNTRFGRSPDADTSGAGLPFGPGYEVACTNPASLGANRRSTFTTLLRSEAFPGVLGGVLLVMYGGPPPSAATPWLQPRERYAGRCEHSGAAHVLLIEPLGDARKLNASPTPDWGLHLADANLPLGDLVTLVGRQVGAYLDRAPRLRCRRGRPLTGADRRLVRRVERKRTRAKVLLYDGRRIALECAG
jgi:DUF3089 family protein